ncbi:hypothetical protein ACIPZF_09155 [Pseudomonas sp. NPDC089752]|uniref:hypothetical protein n=1 Tax=Pseudomonas sp. NPDC089752 TaxID=3364472 RepID=UPI0038303765
MSKICPDSSNQLISAICFNWRAKAAPFIKAQKRPASLQAFNVVPETGIKQWTT